MEHGFSSCTKSGLVAPQHVESLFPNQGLKPNLLHCRQILNHWTTRESPDFSFSFSFSFNFYRSILVYNVVLVSAVQ